MSSNSIDLSGLHHEIDLLKSNLCTCGHVGECMACKGFEMLREQAQMVVAAASQPVLLQVGQEAALKDLAGQMEQLRGKLQADPELQSLMEKVMERVQTDVGGPEQLRRLFEQMGFPGMGGLPPSGS